jgi:hypothetical protein
MGDYLRLAGTGTDRPGQKTIKKAADGRCLRLNGLPKGYKLP